MLGIRARAAGRQPSELLPPIENELAESDLNDAVTLALYLFEQKREAEARLALARATAYELARVIAPGLGLKLNEPGDDSSLFTPEADEYLERISVPPDDFGAIFNGQ